MGVHPQVRGGCVQLQLQRLLLLLSFAACIAPSFGYVQFEPVLVPRSPKEQNSVQGTMKVTYGLFSTETFNKIARTTEIHNCILPGCTRMGEVLDITRVNVSDYDRDTLETRLFEAAKGTEGRAVVDFSHSPSGGILLEEEEVKRWFMLYQFEKPNPGSIYRIRMRLENDTDLASRLTVPVDFSRQGGLWKPRSATTTPSSTYLGTEGIPPDVRLYDSVLCLRNRKRFDCLDSQDPETFIDIMDFMRYFQRPPQTLKNENKLILPPKDGIPGFKPYRYGYPFGISLTVNDEDRVLDEVEKHYAMGRLGAAGIAVMQDGFNVYMSGGKGGLFRYLSPSGDFRNGELFAALIKLLGKPRGNVKIDVGSTFKFEWISLGETNMEDLTELVSIDSKLKFSNIFNSAEPQGGACPTNFKIVNIGGRDECLSTVDISLAAVFEPERFAAIQGATVDVFKFSQMATRLDADRFYLAAESITGGELEVDKAAALAPIEPNMCGCVFEVLVNDVFEATQMKAIMCGDPSSGTDQSNRCNTERVANPRAMTYANKFEYLLVGEDTEFHENNMAWAWDPETGRATRIFSGPEGGGISTMTWFQDVVGGNNYIGITIAEPFDRFGWLSYFGSFDLTAGNKLTFAGVPVPYARGPKKLPIGFSRVTAGDAEKMDGWRMLFKTGQSIPLTSDPKNEVVIGMLLDSDNRPVDRYQDGPVKPERIPEQELTHKFGFNSLISMCDNIFSVGVVDGLPSVSYVFNVHGTEKALEVTSANIIDWSEWGGLWRVGGGTVSPWNTHIGGEVFEPDGLNYVGFSCLTGFSSCFKSRAEEEFENSIQFIRYFDRYLDDLNNKFAGISRVFNPYRYGYIYEVKINKDGCISPTKYMTLGRFSHGGIQIMPDQKTVYMTDWTIGRSAGGGLFKFIADEAGDLSAGTLYAARFKPKFGTLDIFDISWVELEHATNDELVEMSNTIKFTDIFDVIPPSKLCTLKTINVLSQPECIEVKKGQRKWAAFFETRRYAALKKASIELANVRGIVYDPNTKQVHISVTRITNRDKIMLQDDIIGSTNDIKVRLAPCGCLYNNTITDDFDITRIEKFMCGTGDFGTVDSNQCNIEVPAGPTDMSSIPGHRALLVGEDSCRVDSRGVECGHVNNVVWAMDSFMRGEEKTRIITAPARKSVSGVMWYPDIQGKSFIAASVSELYETGLTGPLNTNDPEGFFGYLGPLTDERADARLEEVKAMKPVCNEKQEGQCPLNPISTGTNGENGASETNGADEENGVTEANGESVPTRN